MGDDRPRVAGIVLAAGRSTRAGGEQKLLIEIEGEAMVRRVVRTARAGRLDPIVVVTGHRAAEVEAAVGKGRGHRFVRNPAPADGIASSIALGVEALPPGVAAAVILLGDMPWVRPDSVRRLVAAHDPEAGASVVVPRAGGLRGNPVLWSARHFAELRDLRGDRGARRLLGRHAAHTRWLDLDDPGLLRDVDRRSDLTPADRGG